MAAAGDQVTYTLEKDDFAALARFLVFETPRGRRIMARNERSILLMLTLVAGLSFLLTRNPQFTLTMGAACVLLFFWMRRTNRKLVVSRVYRTILPSDVARFRTPSTLRPSPEGLNAQHGDREPKRIAWPEVSHIGRDDDHIFIVLGQANAFVIPGRCFEATGHFEAFYESARQYRQAALGRPGAISTQE